jgi:hypothetical protein
MIHNAKQTLKRKISNTLSVQPKIVRPLRNMNTSLKSILEKYKDVER